MFFYVTCQLLAGPFTHIIANMIAFPNGYVFNKYLYIGMTMSGNSDPDVVALQKRLTDDGVYSGPITGYFGPLTKAGLQAFQKKNGLDPVGVLGPQTRALLNI